VENEAVESGFFGIFTEKPEIREGFREILPQEKVFLSRFFHKMTRSAGEENGGKSRAGEPAEKTVYADPKPAHTA